MLLMDFITFRLPEVRQWVGLAGGRTGPLRVEEVLEKVREIDEERGTVTQVFDAGRVAGRVHLAHAARLALLSHSRGSGFADSLAVELVCWVAAEKQIKRALEKVGLREDSRTVALLSVGGERQKVEGTLGTILRETGMEREDGVMELHPSKLKILTEVFSLPREMVRKLGVQKLVLERVALLALER
jgi:tRNA threonylcarbamoyladenosine modification (KEOPS) complex Cgi121 subunit